MNDERPAILGDLYRHHADRDRYLFVPDGCPYPSDRFALDVWRLAVKGFEMTDHDALLQLKWSSFYVFRQEADTDDEPGP